MIHPIIALVGRPNVGKSTLFNRLTRTRDALVADFPGLTRDRKYQEADIHDRQFTVIDTAGIADAEHEVEDVMSHQSLLAIEEADQVFFLVDARAGMTTIDQEIADMLRQKRKQVTVVVNKIDGVDEHAAMADFYSLGFEQVYGIAATQNRGIRSLVGECIAEQEQVLEEQELEGETSTDKDEFEGIKIAIIGRPNVGKSTLVNRILGEERVVVFDLPGTTRDSVYIPFERGDDEKYVLIDTAGVRRRGKIKETVEKFSIIKTLEAITDSEVTVLVIDGSERIADQDLHLLSYAIEKGRAIVIAVNKWDGLDHDHKIWVKSELERKLRFINYAEIHFISALHGTAVGDLYPAIRKAYQAANERFSSSQLTRLLEDCLAAHQPPLVNGRRIKLRYAHMGGTNPPKIIIHGNQTADVPDSYKKYLENTFRKHLKIEGTPIQFEFKTGDNPFEGKKNKLTKRQIVKKKRLMGFHKKKDKKRKQNKRNNK